MAANRLSGANSKRASAIQPTNLNFGTPKTKTAPRMSRPSFGDQIMRVIRRLRPGDEFIDLGPRGFRLLGMLSRGRRQLLGGMAGLGDGLVDPGDIARDFLGVARAPTTAFNASGSARPALARRPVGPSWPLGMSWRD